MDSLRGPCCGARGPREGLWLPGTRSIRGTWWPPRAPVWRAPSRPVGTRGSGSARRGGCSPAACSQRPFLPAPPAPSGCSERGPLGPACDPWGAAMGLASPAMQPGPQALVDALFLLGRFCVHRPEAQPGPTPDFGTRGALSPSAPHGLCEAPMASCSAGLTCGAQHIAGQHLPGSIEGLGGGEGPPAPVGGPWCCLGLCKKSLDTE